MKDGLKKEASPMNELLPHQRRYNGVSKTPFLWSNSLEGLRAYEPTNFQPSGYPQIETSPQIRLGKLVEEFVFYELQQDESVELLAANIQIFRDRITIGELDCLIRKASVNIHLELIYKFYLYDPAFPNELDRWIGPNRKDSFVLKLNKLKEKQLPLLHLPETIKALSDLHINTSQFQQQVYFKAQLFVPFGDAATSYSFINNACIKGFYIRLNELTAFPDHTFHIPSKLDWLVEPYPNVDWLSERSFSEAVSQLLSDRKAPLCWMRSPDGTMQKFFVVWWD